MDDTVTDKTELAKTDNELKVIFSAHDDWRRVIAAGKVQRWDVVKWGVTVNTALAALAANGDNSIEGSSWSLCDSRGGGVHELAVNVTL
jgi:hypothetical protein